MKVKILSAVLLVIGIGVGYFTFTMDKDEVLEVSVVEKSPVFIVGTWQSDDDSNSVMVYDQNGGTQDLYNGKVISKGTWSLTEVDSEGGEVLSIMKDGERFDYTVLESTKETLVLSYRARGNTLTFHKAEDIPSTSIVIRDPEKVHEYKNEEYGFSLSYRDTWEVQEALKPQEMRALHEVVISERKNKEWRGSLTVQIFTNESEDSLVDWWEAWMEDEKTMETECREEYGEESPCLFLNEQVENVEEVVLAGEDVIKVSIFQFDHTEECFYSAQGDYVYGLCAPGENPNDSKSEEHLQYANEIRQSFIFDLENQDR